jgi:hypothetical protein
MFIATVAPKGEGFVEALCGESRIALLTDRVLASLIAINIWPRCGQCFGAVTMSELDEAWVAALAEAEQRARLAGRGDIADYLALRNSNDLLRKAAVDWLVTSFAKHAGDVNRTGASIQIANTDGHRFRIGNSTMVGRLVTLTNGVRKLFVEAGWPRMPRDGIVRGGGLAAAQIRHLGIRSAGEELLLSRSQAGSPQWTSVTKERREFHESDIPHHLSILLDNLG